MPNEYSTPSTSSGRPHQQVLPPEAKDTLVHDAEAVVETAKSEFDKAATQVSHDAGNLAHEAHARIDDVAHKAKGLAGEQKDLLAGQIGGVAEAMRRVADDLTQNDASGADYARTIADSASRISETVRDNDVDALVGMAQDFGRKQPVAFMGAAALLGFAASRFVLASAKREDERSAPVANEGTDAPAYPSTGRA